MPFDDWWELHWNRIRIELGLSETSYTVAKILFRQSFCSGMYFQMEVDQRDKDFTNRTGL